MGLWSLLYILNILNKQLTKISKSSFWMSSKLKVEKMPFWPNLFGHLGSGPLARESQI
jgi:hypothetical protein